MGTNQQPAPYGQLSISKEEKRKQNLESNEAYTIEPGYRERARLGDDQTPVPIDQGGPRPRQYETSSNRESPASSQQAGIPGQYDRTVQYSEAQVGNQRHLGQDSGRIQTLMGQIGTLSQQLQQEQRKKNYYKLKTLEFYLRLCIHEPGMPAGHRRRAETILVTDSTPPTFTQISSVTIPSDSRPSALLPSAVLSASHPFAPPPSAATPSVPHPSIPHPSIPHPSIPRPSTTRPSASRPSASRPSAPPPPAHRSYAPRPSAPRHGAVLSSAPSRCTPGSASPVTASALHIDLTIDDTPPSSHTSQKRKWASEQERQAGDHLRKNILRKKFEWMEPKDRPNFKNRNP